MNEYITFGNYAGNPVEWLVLERTPEKVLLLSRYILDAKRMSADCIYTSWGRSSLRQWLNQEFLQKAFSPEEQERILLSDLFTPDCVGYETYSQNYTKDKIFLLSEEELYRYLPNHGDRTAPAEVHAMAYSQDLKDFMSLLPLYQERQNCWWWLRSFGDEPNNFGVVWSDGSVFAFGHYANYERGIRPALYLAL
ncbi:MAG: hypothetical protein IJ644_04780 [Oscillospiraceae bacterium]|nr:hypothetical protein [Oscillospiraceae bacterium]